MGVCYDRGEQGRNAAAQLTLKGVKVRSTDTLCPILSCSSWGREIHGTKVHPYECTEYVN